MLDDKMLELNRKIQQVLNRKEVKTDNEIITFYELANSCKEAMFPYNYFFYTDTAEIAKDINFRIQFKNMLGKNIPYIGEVIPTIDEEGKCYVNVGLVNNSNNRNYLMRHQGTDKYYLRVHFLYLCIQIHIQIHRFSYLLFWYIL